MSAKDASCSALPGRCALGAVKERTPAPGIETGGPHRRPRRAARGTRCRPACGSARDERTVACTAARARALLASALACDGCDGSARGRVWASVRAHAGEARERGLLLDPRDRYARGLP